MTDNQRFKVGGMTSPITSSTAEVALFDIDRPIHDCLDFLAGVLAIHVEPRFQAQLSAAGVVIDGNPDGYIVKDALPYDPVYWLVQSDYLFPLLAVHRASSEYFEKTLGWDSTRSQWVVDFVLPPLDARQAEKLQSFTVAAAKVIRNRLELGFDPSYLSGARWMTDAGVGSIKVIDATFQPFRLKADDRGGTALICPAVSIKLQVEERDQFLSGDWDNFDGVDGYVDAGTTEDLAIDHIIFKQDL